MGPPGGGRNDITSRFVRHLNVMSIESFDDDTLCHVFKSIVNWQFIKGYESSVQRLGKVIYYLKNTTLIDRRHVLCFFVTLNKYFKVYKI